MARFPFSLSATRARERFAELYRAQRDPLYAYCLGMLGDAAAAEDVVQLAFERAWRRRHVFDLRRGSPRAWLYAIARNAARDELRRRGRHALPVEELPERGAKDARLDDLEHGELRAAVLALPERDRELIALRYWADLPDAEISRITGLSRSNVSTRIGRALRRLRGVLEADDGSA